MCETKIYTAKQVADKLKIQRSTVTKWIRDGELKASITSMRNGYTIEEQDLFEFLKAYPKYYSRIRPRDSELPSYTYYDKLNDMLEATIKARDSLNERIEVIKLLLQE